MIVIDKYDNKKIFQMDYLVYKNGQKSSKAQWLGIKKMDLQLFWYENGQKQKLILKWVFLEMENGLTIESGK